MKNIVIFHHNDLDGYGAAAVVYNMIFNNANDNSSVNMCTFLECNYGSLKVTASRLIEAGFKHIEQIYIVDLSFSNSDTFGEVYKILEAYPECKINWIDHHEASINFLSTCKDDGTFQVLVASHKLKYYITDKHSGAWLAWEYMNNQILAFMPQVVKYIDDYDRWVHNYPESKWLNNIFWSYKPGTELKSPNSRTWNSIIYDDTILSQIIQNGKIIADYKSGLYEGIFKSYAYVVDDFEGYKAIVLNSNGNSECFCDAYDSYPICILWRFNGSIYTYSLYSNPKFNVNCNEIAVKYGGGGHPGAAGFATDELLPALRSGHKEDK